MLKSAIVWEYLLGVLSLNPSQTSAGRERENCLDTNLLRNNHTQSTTHQKSIIKLKLHLQQLNQIQIIVQKLNQSQHVFSFSFQTTGNNLILAN